MALLESMGSGPPPGLTRTAATRLLKGIGVCQHQLSALLSVAGRLEAHAPPPLEGHAPPPAWEGTAEQEQVRQPRTPCQRRLSGSVRQVATRCTDLEAWVGAGRGS